MLVPCAVAGKDERNDVRVTMDGHPTGWHGLFQQGQDLDGIVVVDACLVSPGSFDP
jgi:hypothetical protein